MTDIFGRCLAYSSQGRVGKTHSDNLKATLTSTGLSLSCNGQGYSNTLSNPLLPMKNVSAGSSEAVRFHHSSVLIKAIYT